MYSRKRAFPKLLARLIATALTLSLLLGTAPLALAAPDGLDDFFDANPNLSGAQAVQVDKTSKTVTIPNGGDHFAVYNGEKTNDFVLEADVDLVGGGYDANKESRCAGLLFGLQTKTTTSRFWSWNCANIDAGRSGEDAFRVFGPGIPDTNHDGKLGDVDPGKTIHLKVDMKASGEFTYSFGNVGGEMRSLTDKIKNWKGGYVGVMSFCTDAKFSNIKLEDRSDGTIDPSADSAPEAKEVKAGDAYKTNLTGLTSYGGTWEVRENGLYSNAIDEGNTWAFSKNTGTNFVYSTDVTFLQDQGAATLLFRADKGEGFEDCYAVNIDGVSQECKIWRETLVIEGDLRKTESENLNLPQKVDATKDKTYTLTAVANGAWLQFYVNGKLVGSTGDYMLQTGDGQGQNTYLKSGYFGLLNWNGEMVFQNTKYTEISGGFSPLAKNITVTSSTGTVETAADFRQLEPTLLQFVGNDATTVNINVTPVSSTAKVVVTGPDGKTYADGKNVPVFVGSNYILAAVTDTKDGVNATATYRINALRRQADEVYYNEPFRGQYHYSVKDGWGNDPNGMVYYKGVYHFSHQYEAGPSHASQVHWVHNTSTDLIHWEEQSVNLYPDSYGSMFSGCAVVDENNTSGLFSGSKGGLVAIITTNGNGQHIEIAHSEDDGQSWIKEDGIAIDWTDDPLQVRDFRDPKVFRWENKWFMVIAGGPLRIYSSDNLLDWKCESTYADLHTECPDLYPIKADDGQLKWVLSRGGRYYKVGDFKQVSGKWTFVPDKAYEGNADGVPTNGVMNFGKDYYAAMTFYEKDFGTAANPTIPELVEINWMNTWIYCTTVPDRIKELSGIEQKFNGTYGLPLTLGLTKQDGKYLLTQTPVKQVETLRDTKNAVVLTGADVTANNDLLKDFSGSSYEIVATFTPAKDTKTVGFEVRKGASEGTKIIYDLANKTMSIDRSKSGLQIHDVFKDASSQSVKGTENADGTVDLHIYVDRACVEAYANGYTVAGGEQIFPKETSTGLSVIVEGGAAKADIAVYPLASIWTENAADTDTTPAPAPDTTPEPDTAPAPDTTPEPDTTPAPDTTPEPDTKPEPDTTPEPTTPAQDENTLTISGTDTVTRAMLAQLLYQKEEASSAAGASYPDVSAASPYAKAIAWASKAGVMTGYMDGTFRPGTPVTCQQFVTALYRYAENNGCDMDIGDAAADAPRGISDWAQTSFRWASSNKLLPMKDGVFVPAGNLTANEVMQILADLDAIIK